MIRAGLPRHFFDDVRLVYCNMVDIEMLKKNPYLEIVEITNLYKYLAS